MKTPQTLAKQLYDKFQLKALEPVAKHACCAFTLMWCCGYDKSDVDAIAEVLDMIKHKAISKECLVYWYQAYKFITGKELKNVQFVTVKNTNELKKYNGKRIAVKFELGKKAHWVGYFNGIIKFNSLDYSECVEKGKITEARILEV